MLQRFTFSNKYVNNRFMSHIRKFHTSSISYGVTNTKNSIKLSNDKELFEYDDIFNYKRVAQIQSSQAL